MVLGSSLRLILRGALFGGRFEDFFLGKSFRKEPNPLILKEWRRGWDLNPRPKTPSIPAKSLAVKERVSAKADFHCATG